MKRYPIVELCARIEGHAVQQQMISKYCENFDDWQGLLERAEREGMAPLLRKHLIESGADFPVSVRRSLNLLYIRHQKLAEIRLKVVEEVLQLFHQHQLTPILIKGAALCLSLYPDPALRPMRDIDILFSGDEVDTAQDVLRKAGFDQSSAPIPPDHHHLASLHKTVDGVKLCFEVHRGLYPDCPPYYPEVDFKQLLKSARKVTTEVREAFVFSHEETLYYLYQHGLRAPLTFETYKLVNVADIIGYVEKYYQVIDWQQVKERFPGLLRSLPLLHHVSPLNFDRLPEHFVPGKSMRHQLPPTPFRGWPQRRVKELAKNVPRGQILKETFFPPRWWVRVYYETGYSRWRYVKALCWMHPKNVLWWMYVYSHFVIQTEAQIYEGKKSLPEKLFLFLRPTFNKLQGLVVVYRKLK
jgi:hypothetical protein